MNDELTSVDIEKIKEEIRYRRLELGPKLGEELRRTREYGDLSENAEYKEAKREKRKNDSRIRYLEALLRTARIIEVEENAECITLFDHVTFFNEKLGAEKTIQLVTTLRQNALLGYVSKESPLGKALMGKRVGDRVLVVVNEKMSYYVVVKKIEKGEDNRDLPISDY